MQVWVAVAKIGIRKNVSIIMQEVCGVLKILFITTKLFQDYYFTCKVSLMLKDFFVKSINEECCEWLSVDELYGPKCWNLCFVNLNLNSFSGREGRGNRELNPRFLRLNLIEVLLRVNRRNWWTHYAKVNRRDTAKEIHL